MTNHRSAPARSARLHFGRWWWALPAIALIIATHYFSTVAGGLFAFTDWTGLGSFRWIGLDNFGALLNDPRTLAALVNTLVLAAASVVVSTLIGVGLAVALNRVVRTRVALRTLFFLPVVLSPLATSYIWKYVFAHDGPLNLILTGLGREDLARTWLADPGWALWTVVVVVVWQNIGYTMVIYGAGLESVPVEVEEAAAIDGANVWQRFVHVVLPATRPALTVATTLGLVNGLRIFDQIMALTGGGPAGATDTLATLIYRETFSLGNFGYGAALALVLTLIILVFAVAQQRVAGGRQEA
jgi:raffinose/stachyose/melibiose transport system permease protein